MTLFCFNDELCRSPYIGFPMAKRMPKIEEICGPIIEQKLMKAEAEKVEENPS